MTPRISNNSELWIKGLLAATISGAANGVITGFAAVGIDPLRFNLQSGMKPTLALAGVSALMSSLIGTSAYLKQSPLPSEDLPADRDEARSRDHADGPRDDDRVHADDRPETASIHDEQHPDRDRRDDSVHDNIHPDDRAR